MINKKFKIFILVNVFLVGLIVFVFFQKNAVIGEYQQMQRRLLNLKKIINDSQMQRSLIGAYKRAEAFNRTKSFDADTDGDIERILNFIRVSSINMISFKKKKTVQDGQLERHSIYLGLKTGYNALLTLLKKVEKIKSVSSLKLIEIVRNRNEAVLDVRLFINFYSKRKNK